MTHRSAASAGSNDIEMLREFFLYLEEFRDKYQNDDLLSLLPSSRGWSCLIDGNAIRVDN